MPVRGSRSVGRRRSSSASERRTAPTTGSTSTSAPTSTRTASRTASRCRSASSTTRSRSGQELAESERRYRMVVDHMSDLIGVMDLEKRVEWIAPTVTSILGWTAEELVGTVFTDLVHPDDMALMDATDAHLATGDVTELRDGRHDAPHPPEGRLLHLDLRLGAGDAWMTKAGRPGSWACYHDVDELVRARRCTQRDRARLPGDPGHPHRPPRVRCTCSGRERSHRRLRVPRRQRRCVRLQPDDEGRADRIETARRVAGARRERPLPTLRVGHRDR